MSLMIGDAVLIYNRPGNILFDFGTVRGFDGDKVEVQFADGHTELVERSRVGKAPTRSRGARSYVSRRNRKSRKNRRRSRRN